MKSYLKNVPEEIREKTFGDFIYSVLQEQIILKIHNIDMIHLQC